MSTARPGAAAASAAAAASLSTPTRNDVSPRSAASLAPRSPDPAHSGYAMNTLGQPSDANSSASSSVATVSPAAPSDNWRRAIGRHLCVFACGRSATPAAPAAAAIRVRLRSTRSADTTTAGVSRSSGTSMAPFFRLVQAVKSRGPRT